ncbi:hypothetical protein GCM10027051_10550 [Niabella terrae]
MVILFDFWEVSSSGGIRPKTEPSDSYIQANIGQLYEEFFNTYKNPSTSDDKKVPLALAGCDGAGN